MKPLIHTVGHSNRGIEQFIELLRAAGTQLLVDVRSYPASRRWPHFGKDALKTELQAVDIDYLHLKDLGGRRKQEPGPQLLVSGLDEQWQSYAMHMRSALFAAAVDRLLRAAQERSVALMCAEKLPENCHRNLLADALSIRDVWVVHQIDVGDARQHELHRLAKVNDGLLCYPGMQGDLFGV